MLKTLLPSTGLTWLLLLLLATKLLQHVLPLRWLLLVLLRQLQHVLLLRRLLLPRLQRRA